MDRGISTNFQSDLVDQDGSSFIGRLAAFEGQARTGENLVKLADDLMYSIKKNGKNDAYYASLPAQDSSQE